MAKIKVIKKNDEYCAEDGADDTVAGTKQIILHARQREKAVRVVLHSYFIVGHSVS